MPDALIADSSFEIDKQLVQILNSLYARMIERLIIRAVRHEHDCVVFSATSRQFSCRSSTNSSTFKFSDQFRLMALGEINRPDWLTPCFLSQVAGNLADVVGLPFVSVSDENQLLFAAEPVQRLPLFC